MARVAIFIMIPVVAVLAWRDIVLERQLHLLAVYDAVHHEAALPIRIALRDQRLDAATWSLVQDDASGAREELAAALAVETGEANPFRARRLEAFINCMLGDEPSLTNDPVLGGRDQRACIAKRQLNKHDGGIVQK